MAPEHPVWIEYALGMMPLSRTTADAVEFLQRVHGSMTKGGRLAVVELAPDETRVKPSAPGWFAVMMLATTADGAAYARGEYEALLAEAGLNPPEAHKVPASARAVLVSIQ